MTSNTYYVISDIFISIGLEPIIKNVHILNFIIEFCKQFCILLFLEITRLQLLVNTSTYLLVLNFDNVNRIINNYIYTVIWKKFLRSVFRPVNSY